MTSGLTNKPSHTAMDETLVMFLREKVNSFIKWDLARFFHDNPHAKDSADNIARYTGRDVHTVTLELNELAESQVLCAETINTVTVYRLTDDAETRVVIDRFMTACHDRAFRVKAIHEVISAMQFSPRHDF